MGDDITAALFAGPELQDGDDLCAFVRRTCPDIVAGHGFGDLAALVAADAVDVRVATELAQLRERLVADADDELPGGLLAVLDIYADAAARTICALSDVRVARHDSPSRVVVAGTEDALRAARQAAAEHHIDVAEVPAPGALHSPAMSDAARRFARALTEVGFRPPALQVYSAVTAEPVFCPIAELARSLEAPVLWTQTARALSAAGATRYVEADGERALSELVRDSLSRHRRTGVAAKLVKVV